MATNFEALKSVNAYPIPMRTLMETAERHNIELTAETSQESLLSKNYRLAKADLLFWLSLAPDISQGGQSFSFTDEQRKQMRSEALAAYEELEPLVNTGCVKFGYKGDRL